MPLFAVTPVLRRGFKKEWWCASAPARPRWREPPRSGARREPGKEPATVAHRISPYLPGREMGTGGGGRQKRVVSFCEGAGGGAGRSVRVSPCWRRGRGCRRSARVSLIPRRNAGNEKQGGWSVRDRGGGTRSPSPRAASPRGDIPTVHSMGRSRRRPGHDGPPATPRIRFPTSSTPDTISHQLHPGYDFPPAPPRIRLLT